MFTLKNLLFLILLYIPPDDKIKPPDTKVDILEINYNYILDFQVGRNPFVKIYNVYNLLIGWKIYSDGSMNILFVKNFYNDEDYKYVGWKDGKYELYIDEQKVVCNRIKISHTLSCNSPENLSLEEDCLHCRPGLKPWIFIVKNKKLCPYHSLNCEERKEEEERFFIDLN